MSRIMKKKEIVKGKDVLVPHVHQEEVQATLNIKKRKLRRKIGDGKNGV